MQEAFTETSKAGPNTLRGIVGAALGGVAGYFLFIWLRRQGIYAGALPGALLGLGCGILVKRRSQPLAVVCGVLALALGLFSEWRWLPFVRDGSFGYFISKVLYQQPAFQLMQALGGVCGWWFALGSARKGKGM